MTAAVNSVGTLSGADICWIAVLDVFPQSKIGMLIGLKLKGIKLLRSETCYDNVSVGISKGIVPPGLKLWVEIANLLAISAV